MKTALFTAASTLLLTLHHAAFAAVCMQDQVVAIETFEEKDAAVIDAMQANPYAYSICRVNGVARSFQWLGYNLEIEPVDSTYRLLRVLLSRALGGQDTGILCVWHAAKDSFHNLPRDPQAIDRPSCPQKQIPLPTVMKASSVSVLAATLLISIDSAFATECSATQLVDVTSATLEVSMDANCVKAKATSGGICSSTECAALIKDLAAKLPDCTVGGKSMQTMYNEGVPDCDKTTATSAGSMVEIGMMTLAAVAVVTLVYIDVATQIADDTVANHDGAAVDSGRWSAIWRQNVAFPHLIGGRQLADKETHVVMVESSHARIVQPRR
ncbi:hypothetical protein FI667_g563, partial [Globisporangium splendens]